MDVADRSDHRRGGRDTDPGDRHQPLDLRACEGSLGELTVDVRDLSSKKVDLAKTRVEGVVLVFGGA